MLLDELAGVGRDARTGGYERLVLSSAELELREWFLARAAALGLDAETDGNGNLWAWAGPPGPGTLLLGSHLDSVRGGGAFDGPLGVASAFAALERLQGAGIALRRPVAIVAFADEEGGRFGIACAGSRLLTGALPAERALALRDVDGISLGEAASAVGLDPRRYGADPARLALIGEAIELHIEQGHLPVEAGGGHAHAPVAGGAAAGLAEAASPLGVATAIWPHGRWRLEFAGAANHAGTTPLAARRDPLLPLANAVLELRGAAERHDALATIGRVEVEPGAVNAIAAAARAWVDARGADEARIRRVIRDLARATGLPPVEESWTAETRFDRELTDAVAELVAPVAGLASGAAVPRLPSGAGHDAGVLALAGIPTAMLLVRNPTGVSHAPGESAEDADVELGVLALAEVVRGRAA
ncbi:allantoate amidohydrolase [Homoserinibacter sp. YIM 151385]|uniref:allantoate amidohydrolase n=1 Tax=Homoserinibacter sp. YIM 151385 TaxID=2985506 RepID=UPI0022F012BD|nr:allantoate amidohydrolase [Homoserinibacter sp. YIM 151385]WBU37673.1 allantoate amidohydrolase [Homoserinibacter sp. YIM 151385]